MKKHVDVEPLLNNLPDDLPYKASVKRVLTQAPSADVAPMEEVNRLKHILDCYAIQYGTVKDRDVVEVVRCKACKWWHERYTDPLADFLYGVCDRPLEENIGDLYTTDKDFCSYGERRKSND
jgi:hypothetical protein